MNRIKDLRLKMNGGLQIAGYRLQIANLSSFFFLLSSLSLRDTYLLSLGSSYELLP